MNKKILKRTLLIIIFAFSMWLFTNHVDAAYISISLNKTNASAGETISGTISSDCIGRVNLSASNGTISTDRVWIEGGTQSFTVTVGSSGSTAITATAENGKMSNAGTDVVVSPAGASISIGASSSGSSSSSSSSNTGSIANGSTSETPTTEESSNANLSNLGIRPNDFSGFKPGTTTYNVTVPEDVESVEVYATAQDSGATISGTGTKTLQKGANTLNVVVIAEDGTTKTYTINVTREGEDETEEEQPEENAEEVKNGLSNISIANLELSPSFDTDVYEYTVKYVGEDTSLDIQTVATDPNYTVEVLGNEDLKEGENIITILVSDSEGNNVATYQVTVNKTLVDEEALAREEEEKQKEEQRRMFMIAGGVIALIVIIVIVIIVKRRRNRAYAEEFSGVPFAGINDDDDYYNDYENNEIYYDDYNNGNEIKSNNDLSTELTQQNEKDDLKNANENQENIEETNDGSNINSSKPQEENLNSKIDNTKEKEEKERAKIEFLKEYDSADDKYYQEEKPRRGRKKGKRFK